MSRPPARLIRQPICGDVTAATVSLFWSPYPASGSCANADTEIGSGMTKIDFGTSRLRLSLLASAVALLVASALHAQTTGTTSDGFIFSDSEGSVTITGYSGLGGVIAVPATIGGDPVTSIGNEAFVNARLSGITLPNGLVSIGPLAFLSNGFTAISIPSTVTTIGQGAFENCQALVSITIPASVTTLGPGAFSGCNALTALSIDAANPSYSTDGFALFDKNKVTLIECLASTVGSYVIPTGVTTIGDAGFTDCGYLTSVSFPSSVANMSSTFPNPFGFCFDLTQITVDPANPYFSSDGIALFNKARTTLIAYSPGVVGTYAVPAGVTSIGESAFSSCRGLVGVTMPSGLTSIGDDAFDGCSNLATATMPNSVISIGGYAFAGCSNLTNVAIPMGLTSIGQSVFRTCYGLTSVTIPSGISSIGASAFQDCVNLGHIAFLGNAPTVDPTAFQDIKVGAVITYLAGTTGWTNPFDGLPATPAAEPIPTPTPTPPPSTSRLINISTRAQVGTGGNILIPGFVVSGSGSGSGSGIESLLVRADGPSLTQFNVSGVLAQPSLSVFDSNQHLIASNTAWGTNSNPVQIASAAAQVGAFAFETNSADCALIVNLPAGQYTVQVSGVNNSTGVALAEVYEVATTGTRLINISTRAQVGTGGNILIPGFVIAGSGTEQLLVRADGPSLTQFSVLGVLAATSLSVFDNTATMIASNTGWGTSSNPSQIATVGSNVGAFALTQGSADSAQIVSLSAGSYTIQVSGVNNSTGVALAEVYEAP
jgi:hypothetical protein